MLNKEIVTLIAKWKINHKMLADKMEMSKGTFNNKLNPTHSSQFSTDETASLLFILSDMNKAFHVELSKLP